MSIINCTIGKSNLYHVAVSPVFPAPHIALDACPPECQGVCVPRIIRITLCELLSEQPVPVRIIGIPDENVIHGTNAEIFHYYGMDAEGIVKAALDFLPARG